MYLEHFGLAVNPFGLSPKLDFLYKSGTFEESMAHLIYGLDNHEAIVLITGAIGTGKTMALQSFLTNLGPRFEFALITNTRVNAIELLKLTLEDLGVDLPVGADKSDLLILFKDYLLQAGKTGKMVLIVIDEAQNLSPDVLEEVRLLTNLGQGESQPVQIILVGQPELEVMVNRPDLAQLRQRIRVHYRLDPLTRTETEEYIHHRMGVAGADRVIFSNSAIDTIFQFSRGVPRLVNTMAGEALLSAFVAGHDKVQAIDVEKDRELSFVTGPAPAEPVVSPPSSPIPEPPPVAEPPATDKVSAHDLLGPDFAPPVPEHDIEPQPVAAPAPPTPAASVEPEPVAAMAAEIPRRARRGMSGAVRSWLAIAVVVAVLGALYSLGYLDQLLAVVRPEPAAQPAVVAAQPETDPLPTEPVDEAPPADVPATDQVADEAAPRQEPAPATERPAVQAVETEVAVPAPTPLADGTGEIFIHISSFRTPDRAQTMVRKMEGRGPGVLYLKRDIRGTDWYRVYMGPFANLEDAYHDALKLKQEGAISYYRVTRIDANDRN
jgi:type II secretory pathway predicted ATPase ExeA